LNPLIDFGVASFFNARKEGLRSEIKAIRAGPGEWSWKRAVHTVAPAVIRWGLASGAFLAIAAAIARKRKHDDGQETDTEAGLRAYKEMYDSIPDYYKMVYACYPVAWVDKAAGKVAFVTMPLEDNEQKLHTALWAALDEAGQKAGLSPTAAGSVKALQSNLAADLPMIGRGGPLINMLRPFFEFYMLGQNPQDAFRGTSLLNDDQFKAGGTYAAKPLLENAWNASGIGGIIHRIEPQQLGADNRGMVEKMLRYPGISESLGKWLRVSNRGIAEQIRQEEAPLLKADAQTRLEVQRAMTEAKGDVTALPEWAVQRYLNDQYFREYWTSLARRTAERDMLTPEERAALRPTTKRTQQQAVERMGK